MLAHALRPQRMVRMGIGRVVMVVIVMMMPMPMPVRMPVPVGVVMPVVMPVLMIMRMVVVMVVMPMAMVMPMRMPQVQPAGPGAEVVAQPAVRHVGPRRLRPLALDMVVVALLGRADLGLEPQNLRAILAH